ncbi:hypothetical protein GCM10008983_00660 [Lentibacillus halophilus]|uniref:N-acetyltransferase domain-containing protein n=1 Tax=Lentibacillus halophilus TaxID=295065 RepID=A0ABN0Z1L6_9BACI
MKNQVDTSSESNVIVRQLEEKDIPEVQALAVMCFGEDVAFDCKHYESQLARFPEGQRCVEYEGKIVGASGSLMVSRNDWDKDHTFDEICDEGYIRNHDPNGDYLYGIEVSVHPDYRNLKLGKTLYNERKELCRQLSLNGIVVGGRIPHYHKYADQYTPETYAELVVNNDIYDPVMTFQLKNDFNFLRILRNYLPDDAESCTHATLMEWKND